MKKISVRFLLLLIISFSIYTLNINVYADENIKDISSCNILNYENKNYTGKSIKQNIKLMDGDYELVLNKDYIITYKNNKNVGNATALIKGINNYKGNIIKKFKIVIGKPVNLVAYKYDSSSISIKWSKPSGSITGYEVYYSTKKDSGYKKLSSTSKTNYKKTKLSANKTYYFKVRAYKTINKKKYYSSYTTIISYTRPKTPSIKVSSGTNYSNIVISKISGTTGYEIYYSIDNKNHTKVDIKNELKYKIDNLDNIKKYYYKVRAYKTINNKKIYSSYSKTLSSITIPNKPSVTFYKDGTSSIINWDKIDSASGYEIYQSTDGKKYFKIKVITNKNITKYTKTKLSSSKTYYYKVRTYTNIYKTKVYSSYSNVISNTVAYMNFTNDGIKIKGSIKNGSGKYSLEACSSFECIPINITIDNNYYLANINIKDLKNDTYKLYITDNGKKMLVYNNLTFMNRINRAKIDNKLVTVAYPNNAVAIKIDNFKYEYDILIDSGHGGSDPGATNKYIKEKDLNLKQTLYEKKRYEEHGLKVKTIRTNDTYGLMLGPKSISNLRRRAYAIGYFGVVSRYAYSNHHNSFTNKTRMGYEILVPNQGTVADNIVSYKIAREWRKIYPLTEDHTRIYGRNYHTSSILSKDLGEVHNIKNYYAVQRIPYELFNLKNVVTYEGCYLSNLNDYKRYLKNWKTLSEIKIKTYVESIGKKYIPPLGNN